MPSPAHIRSTIATIAAPPEDLREMAVFHKALSDPTRLRILQRLADRPGTVTELIDYVDLSQPLVSRLSGMTLMAKGSLLSPELRANARGRIEPIARLFGRVGLTPNALTVIGLLIAVIAAVLAANQAWFVTGLLVVFGGAFDLFDGALARATGTTSKFGAFLDSTLDRAGEAIVYLGIIVGLGAHEAAYGPVLAGAAMASAFMVSYTRAKSESLGYASGTGMANVGLAPREIRIVILTLGLLLAGILNSTGALIASLALIAVLATITTIQRILAVRAQSSVPMQSEDNR